MRIAANANIIRCRSNYTLIEINWKFESLKKQNYSPEMIIKATIINNCNKFEFIIRIFFEISGSLLKIQGICIVQSLADK